MYDAQAAAAGSSIAPYAKRLPALRRQMAMMVSRARTLHRAIVASRKTATAALVTTYISDVTGVGSGVSTSFSPSNTGVAVSLYSGIVVHARHDAIVAYRRTLARDGSAAQLLLSRIKVLEATIPNLFLSAKNLTSEVASTRAAIVLLSKGHVRSLAASGPVLSIKGSSVTTAAEMAGWYNAQGYTNNSGVPILALSTEYLRAGAAQGVAGDVAFAQSVLETGGFSSMSGSFNFAGIGACNSCNGGYNYPSYREGIRAQIQLLAGYATKGLTSRQLVGGAAYHGIDTLSVRGCCALWSNLSKVWSTGAHYGEVVLGIYTSMLKYSISHT
jgi:hypothetical protein